MAYRDYHSILTNHTLQYELGRHLNYKISALIINYLLDSGYGRFGSSYAARKAVTILSFKPSAKIFLFNGDYFVVDFRKYKVLKSFVSFICSLDFRDNDIDITYIESYFSSICCYYANLNEQGYHETTNLNPAPLPDFVNEDLSF